MTPKSRWEDAKSRWGDASPYNLRTVVNQNEGQGPLGPRSDGAEFAKRQNFFFHRNKDLYLLFYPRLSLILSGCLFLHLTFFGTFAKCWWYFGYAIFRGWCDCKLAIIKPSKFWSTYRLLIKWLIFSCRVNFHSSLLCDSASNTAWDCSDSKRERSSCGWPAWLRSLWDVWSVALRSNWFQIFLACGISLLTSTTFARKLHKLPQWPAQELRQDASYHTANLREQLLAKVRLTLQK